MNFVENAEKDLHLEDDEKYRDFFDNANEAIIINDIEDRVSAWNPAAEKMFGWEAGEAIGKNPAKLIVPQDKREERYRIMRNALSGRKIDDVDTQRMRKDGTRINVSLTVFPLRDKKQNIIGLSYVLKDITRRKRAEEALKKSEEKYRNLFDNSNDAIITIDMEDRVTSWNRSAERIFGWKAQEVTGKNLPELIIPGDLRDEREQIMRDALSGKNINGIESTRLRKDGSRFDASLTFSPIKDSNHNTIGLSGIIRDITERKRIEETLKKAYEEVEIRVEERTAELAEANKALQAEIEERRRAEDALREASSYTRGLIEASLDPLVTISPDGKIMDVNHSTELVTGFSREKLIGSDFSEYFTESEKARKGYQEVFSKEFVKDYPLAIRHTSGKITDVMYNAAVYRNESGEVLGVFAAARDITGLKRAEEEIRRLNSDLERRVMERTAQLEAANKELEAFSYSVSHDLRAPLRSIDGFSQALLEDYTEKLDMQGKDYLARVRAASQRMSQLIDDMLILSRVTRREMKSERVDLSALSNSIAAELKKTQPERQVEFIIAPGLVVNGDGELLRAMLENLFGNAWKFTSKHAGGKIEFGVLEYEGKPAYFVRDDGVGFNMAYADKLFKAFQRLHGSNEFPGTGIGLATVKRIIQRHGGEIWAKGEVGKGATFYFNFDKGGKHE